IILSINLSLLALSTAKLSGECNISHASYTLINAKLNQINVGVKWFLPNVPQEIECESSSFFSSTSACFLFCLSNDPCTKLLIPRYFPRANQCRREKHSKFVLENFTFVPSKTRQLS